MTNKIGICKFTVIFKYNILKGRYDTEKQSSLISLHVLELY
jgi:hypothetical protein